MPANNTHTSRPRYQMWTFHRESDRSFIIYFCVDKAAPTAYMRKYRCSEYFLCHYWEHVPHSDFYRYKSNNGFQGYVRAEQVEGQDSHLRRCLEFTTEEAHKMRTAWEKALRREVEHMMGELKEGDERTEKNLEYALRKERFVEWSIKYMLDWVSDRMAMLVEEGLLSS